MDVNKGSKHTKFGKISKVMLCLILAMVCVFSFTACNDDQISALETEVKSLQEKYSITNTATSELQTKLATANTDLAALTTKAADLETNYKELDKNLKALSAEGGDITVLKADMVKAKADIVAVNEAIAAVTESIKALATKADLAKVAEDLSKDLADHVKAYNALKKDFDDHLTADHELLKKADADLKKTIDDHLVEYGLLAGRVKDAEDAIKAAEEAIADLDTKVDELNEAMAARVEVLETALANYKDTTVYAAQKASELMGYGEYVVILYDDAYTFAFAEAIIRKHTALIARSFTAAEVDTAFDAGRTALSTVLIDARVAFIAELTEDLVQDDYTTSSWEALQENIADYIEYMTEIFNEDQGIALSAFVENNLPSYSDIEDEIDSYMNKLVEWAAYIGAGSVSDGVKYDTLKEAIDAAKSGDVINVKSGTYTLDKFSVNIDLTIRNYKEGARVKIKTSTTGVTNVMDYGTTFITVNNAKLVLQNIDFVSSKEELLDGSFVAQDKYAFECQGAAALEIDDCTFTDFRSGMYLNNATLKLTDSVFKTQGGISVQEISNILEITGNEFYGNGAGGVEASLNSYADYVAFVKTFKENNVNENAGATLEFYAYGRFSDGVWLVNQYGTSLDEAIEYYQDGDIIYLSEGTYELDPMIGLTKSVSFEALEGAEVSFESTSESAGTNYFFNIKVDGDVSFKDINFVGLGQSAIFCAAYDVNLTVDNCTFVDFDAAIYVTSKSTATITNSSFTTKVGIKANVALSKVTLTNNEFACSTESVGVEAGRNTYVAYNAFVAAFEASNTAFVPEFHRAAAPKLIVNAYGRFTDGVWLIKTGITNIETAIKNYEAGDRIILTDSEYNVDRFDVKSSLTIETLNAITVTINSTTTTATPNYDKIGFIAVQNYAENIVLNVSNVNFVGVDQWAIAAGSSAITLNVDTCEFEDFRSAFYIGQNTDFTLTDSKIYTGGGLGNETALSRITMTGNEFYGNGVMGIDAPSTTYVAYNAFVDAFLANNPNENEDATLAFYIYNGKFTDNVWLVNPNAKQYWAVTFEDAIKGYEAGDTIYMQAGTYNVAAFAINNDVTISALKDKDGKYETVNLVSTSVLGESISFINIHFTNPDDTDRAPITVNLNGIKISGADHNGIVVFAQSGITLNVDSCTFAKFAYCGIYVNSPNKATITNSTFKNMTVGIATDSACENIVIGGKLVDGVIVGGNTFDSTITVTAVEAFKSADTAANFAVWARDIYDNNPNTFVNVSILGTVWKDGTIAD